MGDQYLVERHAYSIAQRVCSEKRRRQIESNSSSSRALLSQTGAYVPQPGERVLHKSERISLHVSVPKALQSPERSQFSLESSDGQVYLTSHQVVYVAARPTDQLKTFSAPILHFEDSYISSPWFGSWYWAATVKPVRRAGVPGDLARLNIKLSFMDGGHNEFRARFEETKEQLHHLSEMQREFGVPDEPLPAYEGPAAETTAAATTTPAPPFTESMADSGGVPSVSRPGLNEPPPAYEDVQVEEIHQR